MGLLRALVLALSAPATFGASASSSTSGGGRSLRAQVHIAEESFQSPVAVHNIDAGAVSWRAWGSDLLSKASGIAQRAPFPPAIRQLLSAFSTDFRSEQDAADHSADQSSHRQVVYLLAYLLYILFFVGLWVALVALTGHFYVKNKQYPGSEEQLATPEQQGSFKEWKFGFCSCLENLEVCCCALLCPCIRWGETLSLVDGLIIFWVGFSVFFCLTTMNWVTSAAGLCWLLLTVICTAYRQELRVKFEMRSVGGCTYVTDFLLYAFCACCAISQEARHVEEAFKYKHKAVRAPDKD